MNSIRILIVDDHEVVRKGVRALIENQPGWRVVGEASNGTMALEQAAALKPDVVVMDISLPELNGLDCTRRLLHAAPASRVLILTMHKLEELWKQALEAGARGILLKSDAGAELVEAIRTISQGKIYLTASASESLLEMLRSPGESSPESSGLTLREREITQLVCEGLSNKEIAARLDVSTRTVETHRARIMKKLGVRSVGDLVRWAIRNHLTEP